MKSVSSSHASFVRQRSDPFGAHSAALHGVHRVAPGKSLKVFSVQGVHSLDSGAVWYVPAGQSSHLRCGSDDATGAGATGQCAACHQASALPATELTNSPNQDFGVWENGGMGGNGGEGGGEWGGMGGNGRKWGGMGGNGGGMGGNGGEWGAMEGNGGKLRTIGENGGNGGE